LRYTTTSANTEEQGAAAITRKKSERSIKALLDERAKFIGAVGVIPPHSWRLDFKLSHGDQGVHGEFGKKGSVEMNIGRRGHESWTRATD
jgi:hypothetical protein